MMKRSQLRAQVWVKYISLVKKLPGSNSGKAWVELHVLKLLLEAEKFLRLR